LESILDAKSILIDHNNQTYQNQFYTSEINFNSVKRGTKTYTETIEEHTCYISKRERGREREKENIPLKAR
jgi:hypothetical protein